MEIVIKTKEIRDDQIENVRINIKSLIDQLSEGLILVSLKKIVVPEDFGEEILALQREYGSTEVGHTNNEFGTAIAKVLHYRKDGEIFHTIVLDKLLIHMLFTEKTQNSAVHYFHHELCHVHDEYLKERIYDLESRAGYGLGHILLVHSDVIWSEYVAERLANRTIDIKQLEKSYIPNLFDNIIKSKEIAAEKICQYRKHRDVDRLFQEIQALSNTMLILTANTQGYIQGINSVELTKVLDDALLETSFGQVWIGLGVELKSLYEIYPDWDGIAQLERLSLVVLKHWNDLGIYPRPIENNGLYIDVPYKAP